MKTICLFGDSVALGCGDAGGGGWPVRLSSLEDLGGHALELYNLSVAQDTSLDVADRWALEGRSRLRRAGPAAGLLFAFGLYDMAMDADDVGGHALQVPLMDSIAQAEAIIGAAREVAPALWIGPAPVRLHSEPLLEHGRWLRFSHARLAALNAAYADVARRLRVPYLDLMAALEDVDAWQAVEDDGNGVHPGPEGHAAIAAALHRWPAWRHWMDGVALTVARSDFTPGLPLRRVAG